MISKVQRESHTLRYMYTFFSLRSLIDAWRCCFIQDCWTDCVKVVLVGKVQFLMKKSSPVFLLIATQICRRCTFRCALKACEFGPTWCPAWSWVCVWGSRHTVGRDKRWAPLIVSNSWESHTGMIECVLLLHHNPSTRAKGESESGIGVLCWMFTFTLCYISIYDTLSDELYIFPG